MAIWRRGKPDALLHYSHQGSQYTSEQFQRLMTDNGVTCSMSRVGQRLGQCRHGKLRLITENGADRKKVYRTRDKPGPMCSITLKDFTIRPDDIRRLAT
jgi:putative transposase